MKSLMPYFVAILLFGLPVGAEKEVRPQSEPPVREAKVSGKESSPEEQKSDFGELSRVEALVENDPIQKVWIEAMEQIRELEAEIEKDQRDNIPSKAPELQKEIERIKIAAEIQVLELILERYHLNEAKKQGSDKRCDLKLVEEINIALYNLRGLYVPELKWTAPEESREEAEIRDESGERKEFLPPPPREYKERQLNQKKSLHPENIQEKQETPNESKVHEEEENSESSKEGGATSGGAR